MLVLTLSVGMLGVMLMVLSSYVGMFNMVMVSLSRLVVCGVADGVDVVLFVCCLLWMSGTVDGCL